MKGKWPLPVGMALLLIITALSGGCGPAKKVIDVSGENAVIVKAVAAPLDTAGIISNAAWDGADETSVRVGEEKAYTNDIGLKVVRVRAIADTAYLYLRFNWVDSSISDRPGHWTYLIKDTNTCQVWTQNANSECHEIIDLLNPRWENEDVLAMLLEMPGNGTEGANCATTCHAVNDTTQSGFRHHTTGGGSIDGWVWRAGRTSPLGLADDQYWGDINQLTHNDSYGTLAYWRNGNPDRGYTEPGWMHRSGHGFKGDTLFVSDTAYFDMTESGGWVSKDGLPGYVLNRGWNSGNISRYDVKASAAYDNDLKRWTVVMWRRLTTPYPSEDVDFKDGRKEYQASLAIMNHAFERHSGSKPFTIKFQ